MWKSMVYDEEYLNDKMKLFEKDKLITTLLLNRKIYTREDANKFLNSSYKQLHDPFLLDNMGKIVEKLVQYIEMY